MKYFLSAILFFLIQQTFSQDVVKIRGKVNVKSDLSGSSVNTFQFSLADSATVSVGIFRASDSILVRTMSSNERLGAGTYIRKWDGLNDTGVVATGGPFYAERLASNVKYEWQTARIGNTSTAGYGGSMHRAGEGALDIAIAGDYLYYVAGYQERFTTDFRVNLGQIGTRTRAHNAANGDGVATNKVCSDGTTIYWGAYNQQGPAFSFVYATNASDGSIKTFSSGATVNPTAGNAFTSGIAYKSGVAAYLLDIQAIAVQKSGNKLFVSRLDTVKVFNKGTGALLQSLYIPGAAKLACDTAGFLWVGLGSSLIKYTVNSDGTIASTGVAITGVLSVGAIAVSPNNYNVVVCDDDTSSQQVKTFRNSNGTSLWTLGTAKGYMDDASVNNNKFYFRDVRTNYLCGITFQSDSSFWVIDGGNSRMQHYTAARSYVNRIMYLGVNYVVQADPNNINRLFAMWGGGATSNGGYLEFAIDYTKTLDSGLNGSWTLVKNWGARIRNDYTYFSKMQNIVTIAGHTYGRMGHETGSIYADIFELVAGGAARKTKVQFDVRMAIGKDSAKYYNPEGAWPMHQSYVYRYTFTGLDSDNDPTWSASPTVVVTTPILDSVHAVMPNAEFKAAYTSTGKWVFFDPVFYIGSRGVEPHLGIQKFGSSIPLLTSYGTLRSYSGDFPIGYFDNGNGVGGPGGDAGGYYTVAGRNIMWTYHGEFWKTSQTNKFNHYYDNGLLVGQFGTLRTDFGDQENAYGGAGNAIHGSWNQYNADTAYVYSGDEGVNSGVARWMITGLTTEAIQYCNFNSSLTVPTPDYVDLMQYINNKNFFSDTSIWSISNTPNNLYDSPPGYFWYVVNGTQTPSTFGPQDVWAFYNQTSGLYSVNIDLGANVNLPNWKVTGRVTWKGNTPADNSQGGYITINDSTGKYALVVQEYISIDGSKLRGNYVEVYDYTDPYLRQSTVYKSKPFELRVAGSTMYFTYDGHTASTINVYTSGANIHNPRTMQLLFSPGGKSKGVSISNLKFYNH